MNLYPTPEHQGAAEAIVEFFTTIPEIEAVCLICSCARSKASRDSCLDILALGKPETMSTAQADIQKVWDEFYTTDPIFQKPAAVGKYAHVDLEFSDGHFGPTEHYWVGGPDEFELVIGNYLVYSVPLYQGGNAHLTDPPEGWMNVQRVGPGVPFSNTNTMIGDWAVVSDIPNCMYDIFAYIRIDMFSNCGLKGRTDPHQKKVYIVPLCD